jgi:hypothetical protein
MMSPWTTRDIHRTARHSQVRLTLAFSETSEERARRIELPTFSLGTALEFRPISAKTPFPDALYLNENGFAN